MDDLPNNVLDLVFSFCTDKPAALVSIPGVCKRWQQVFACSSCAFPHLKLLSPAAHLAWLEQHSNRLVRLTLRQVEDLVWIECLRNLQSLVLEDSRRFEDLTPLTSLHRLDTLSINNCRNAADLQPLLSIPSLRSLAIERCFARDLTPLSGHASLEELHLAYDCWSVMSLKLPASLPGLQRMRIMSAIPDLEPLSVYTSLRELEVYAVSVYDLSPLSHLTGLLELDLHHLQEEELHGDMSPLSTLVNLKSLGLQGSDASIVELNPWPCLTNLTRVDLHGSCVSSLTPLVCLSGLKALDLTEARQLSDLRPLSVLVALGLSELVLTGCRKVHDLRPVLPLMAVGGVKKDRL